MDFTLEKCKTKAAYSTKLVKGSKIDLAKVKEKFEVVLETPILLVIRVDSVEIVVHGYGELLFKGCDDIELMRSIARQVYECLE
jgi:hypothetical protein